MSVRALVVVERPDRELLSIDGVDTVSARDYLTDPSYSERRRLRVYNLCRTFKYQSVGYYVSLLAEARGHHPLPDVATIQDLKSLSHVRLISEELDEIVQHSLAPIGSSSFTLSVYFGRNVAERHSRLARALFGFFPAPLLRAELRRETDEDTKNRWRLTGLRAIELAKVPESHRPFLAEAAESYFRGRREKRRAPKRYRYDLAMLVDPKASEGPSNEKALRRIERAGEQAGVWVERITKDDFSRLAEFDGLLIRETTMPNHYTYRFARRAAAQGLVVIDDPESILRCTNKVFLTELLLRHDVPIPKTLIVHKGNVDQIVDTLGLPAVLKLPDGSFSKAVVKARDEAAVFAEANRFLSSSDLLVAQEYLPTDFDWRIGLLDGEPLFAARYGMAKGHWQIARHSVSGSVRYGTVEAVALDQVPPEVLSVARRAGAAVGRGFYGVDLKEGPSGTVVIEVNDNPNLDAGEEDAIGGEEIYRQLIDFYLQRFEQARKAQSS